MNLLSVIFPNDIAQKKVHLRCKKGTKKVQDTCSPFICDIWTEEIVRKGTFPKGLKKADVTPVFEIHNTLLALFVNSF